MKFVNLFLLFFLKDDTDISASAKAVEFPQPCLIVRKMIEDPRAPTEAYVATEGQVLCKVPLEQAPFVLLSTFYTFNMQYTNGCTNFYSFLEYLFLETVPPKRSKLQYFITSLANIEL